MFRPFVREMPIPAGRGQRFRTEWEDSQINGFLPPPGNSDAASKAARQIFQQYLARLIALARTRLSPQLQRRLNPEDLVMSAFRSYFVGARQGKWGTEGDLWSLLATITLRKAARQARQHRAGRRSVSRETEASPTWEPPADHQPTAEDAVLLQDEIEWLIGFTEGLDREILLRQLRGDDAYTIARELEISERTVRRSQQRVRELVTEEPSHRNIAQSTQGPNPRELLQDAKPTVSLEEIRLYQFIGQGSTYKVFEGHHQRSGSPVAVKFLKKASWGDPRGMAACLREFRILTRIQNPHLERVLGWGRTTAGAIFLLTEFTNACDLSNWVVTRRPLSEILRMACEIGSGLAVAHEQGVIHCDVKPQNVLVDTSGRYRLIDFGMAQWREDEDSKPGGTLGYLAPEQISPAFGKIDARTDVYGLGALIYALLTGTPPWPGDYAHSLQGLLSPDPVQPLGSDIPGKLAVIVERALSKSPEDRYPDVTIMVGELHRLRS